MVAMSKAGEWQGRISGYIRKLGRWKYPVLVLLLGVILLLLPQKQERTEPKNSTEPQEVFSGMDVQEQELETLLSQIDGAGKVRVMLSLEAGEETRYQTDTREQTDGAERGSFEESVVLYSTGSGAQGSLVRQRAAPSYRGAIILCQGADDPTVRYSLIQAVASITGLRTDRITVVKMK